MLSTAHGASESKESDPIFVAGPSMTDLRVDLEALLSSSIVPTDATFSEDIGSISPMTKILDLSKVTMDTAKTGLILKQLGQLILHKDRPATVTAPAHDGISGDISSLIADIKAKIDSIPLSDLHTIKFGPVSDAAFKSILFAVNSMPNVKKIELAEGAHINIHALELQALSTIREDLNITPVDFCYRGPWGSLLAQLERGPIPQLTNLDLSSNAMGIKGAKDLACALRHVPKLRTLNLAGNYIYSHGASALVDHLGSVPNLTILNLESNHIGSAGARAIADHLESVPQLRELNLGRNFIGDAGASALADHLGSVPKLTTLSLKENIIGDPLTRALRAAAARRPGLTLEL